MFVVPLVLGCIRFGCRRLYLYISRAFVAVCIYILLVACLCIYIFRWRSSQFAFIYCSSHVCAFLYFAGVRRSLHFYIALRMLVFHCSSDGGLCCVVQLCFVDFFFPFVRCFVCCCSLRSILAAARLKKAWAVDYAAMHDVPNGVFLPWKSQRAYSTGYSW